MSLDVIYPIMLDPVPQSQRVILSCCFARGEEVGATPAGYARGGQYLLTYILQEKPSPERTAVSFRQPALFRVF